MIVCICAAVNTQQVEEAQQTRNTFDHIQFVTGACQECKCCKHEIEHMVANYDQASNRKEWQ